jgi:hypothetical protein
MKSINPKNYFYIGAALLTIIMAGVWFWTSTDESTVADELSTQKKSELSEEGRPNIADVSEKMSNLEREGSSSKNGPVQKRQSLSLDKSEQTPYAAPLLSKERVEQEEINTTMKEVQKASEMKPAGLAQRASEMKPAGLAQRASEIESAGVAQSASSYTTPLSSKPSVSFSGWRKAEGEPEKQKALAPAERILPSKTSTKLPATFSWDPVSESSDLREATMRILKEKGYRFVADWKDALLLVALEESTDAYKKKLPDTEQTIYSPYGPFYPHTGYRQYRDSGSVGTLEEAVEPGYTIDEFVAKVRVSIRKGNEPDWHESGWAVTEQEDGTHTQRSILREVLESFPSAY